MSSILEELPFCNASTKDIIRCQDKNEDPMKTILQSYGLSFKRIIYRLKAADAYIGGSTATLANSKYNLSFQPGDLDLYIQDTKEHRIAAKNIVTYMMSCGYEVDAENSFTDFLGKMKSSYTPDNNHINEIWSLKNAVLGKSIQLVLLDMEPVKYIIEETDLSCTSIAINCSTESVTYDLKNEICLKRRQFYVNPSYHDIYDGKCGNKKQEKLMNRIRKYEERGLKFIGKEPFDASKQDECFMRFDRIPKEAKKHRIHSVLDHEEVTLYAGLRRSCSIVIYVNKEKGYLVNRNMFYEYCNNNDKTYWGHALYRNQLDMSCAPMIMFEMYRLFVLRKMHNDTYVLEPKMVGDVVGKKEICV